MPPTLGARRGHARARQLRITPKRTVVRQAKTRVDHGPLSDGRRFLAVWIKLMKPLGGMNFNVSIAQAD